MLNDSVNIMEDKRICLHIIQLFLAVNNEMQQSRSLKKKKKALITST